MSRSPVNETHEVQRKLYFALWKIVMRCQTEHDPVDLIHEAFLYLVEKQIRVPGFRPFDRLSEGISRGRRKIRGLHVFDGVIDEWEVPSGGMNG